MNDRASCIADRGAGQSAHADPYSIASIECERKSRRRFTEVIDRARGRLNALHSVPGLCNIQFHSSTDQPGIFGRVPDHYHACPTLPHFAIDYLLPTMSTMLSRLPPRQKFAAIGGATIIFLFLLHIIFPSATPRRWSTASSYILRSTFLRAKAQAPRPPIHHPIPKLMADARATFDTMLSRQSKTLDQAVAEYERRYSRKPPKGFDEWFKFAKDNDAVIIDEYDQLSRDLQPFWAFSGEEIRRRCIQVGFLPSVDLVRIENGTTRLIDVSKGFDDSEVGARAKGFRFMLERFEDRLPNMDFPINEKAEGRILVPWEERVYPNLTADSSGEPASGFSITDCQRV